MSKPVSISINIAFVVVMCWLGLLSQGGFAAVLSGFSAGMNFMAAIATWRDQ